MHPQEGAGRGVQAGAGREETSARPSAFDLPKILLGTVRRCWLHIWPDRSRLAVPYFRDGRVTGSIDFEQCRVLSNPAVTVPDGLQDYGSCATFSLESSSRSRY